VISIIIPVYNGEKFIGHCLNSVFKAKINVPFEVIAIDDGSTDNTAGIVRQFPCGYFKIEKSGVSAARNAGIKKAKGEIIFFFDADVRLKEDTITRFSKHFEEDRNAYIIQGRWDKESSVPGFSSRFLLLKYAYNFMGQFKGNRRIEWSSLETGCLGVRAEVFERCGGFDEGYKFAGGEEHEFAMRVLNKYKIFYYRDIFVGHAFESIFKAFKKTYKRTVNFSMLSFKSGNKNFIKPRKNFIPIQDRISVLLIFLLLCSSSLFFFDIKLASIICTIILFMYLANISKFLLYLRTERNAFFAITGIAAHLAIMFPRLLGILKAGYMFYILRQTEFKI
jgi:glycosyltransferase involved in cell wall biosynthesis